MFLVSPGETSVPFVCMSKVLIIYPQKRLLVQTRGHCEWFDEKPPEFAPNGRISSTYAIQ